MAIKSNAYDIDKRRELNTEPDELLIDIWLAEDFNYEPGGLLIEQKLAMPNYTAVLTIIYEN